MKKISLLLGLALTLPTFAALKTFSPQENVKASDINNNFNEIKTVLTNKNTPVTFNHFLTGSVIDKADFELEFDKVRNLGVAVTPLSSEKILATELNAAFVQMLVGVQTYNDLPTTGNSILVINEDEPNLVNFNYINNVGLSNIQIVSPPSHGALTPSGSSFIYTPSLNYFGTDSISFQIFDGEYTSNISEVSLTVNSVNDAPVANSQNLNVTEDSALAITLTATDIENSPLTYEIISVPTQGTLTGTPPNLTYTPNLNYFGVDSFIFKVSDGLLSSANATVTLNIGAINDDPLIAGASELIISETMTNIISSVSGSDIDSDPLTYAVAAAPSKGVVTWGSNGSYTYTANLNAFGSDSFTVRAFDGSAYSAPLSVNVSITIPKSCKDLLALRPNLLNQNNTYYIDLDGTGSLAPGQVLCDMTTDNGGWTNLAANIGSFSNVLKAKLVYNNTPFTETAQALSTLGINAASTATAAVGGALVSRAAPGGCVGYIPKLYVTAQLMDYIKPTHAKLIAKSYGTASYDCGGMLRHSDLNANTPALVRINPTNFDIKTLARCEAGGYATTATSADLTFSTPFRTVDYTKDNAVAALEAICGTGTGYIQIKQLWVR